MRVQKERQPRSTRPSKSKSKRGAQRSNTNAQRHGVYSQRLSADEYQRFVAAATDALNLADELGIARVLLDRVIARMAKTRRASDWHKLRRAADEQLGRIGHLMRQQKSLGGDSSPLAKLVDDILDGVSEKLGASL